MKTQLKTCAVAALLAGALVSCESPLPEPLQPGEGTVTETIEVSFGDHGAASKVDIASITGKFSWSDGDQIAVWYQNGNSGAWSTGPVTAQSQITVTVTGTGTRAKLAVYPAGVQTNFNLTAVNNASYPRVTKIKYPAEIDLSGKDDYYAPMPMIALNDPQRSGLKFFHVGGVIRFKLYGVPAGTVKIRIHSDASPLSGEFPVAIPTGNEVNAAALVYNETQWANDYSDASWDQLFKPSHSQDVLVRISSAGLAAEGDGIRVSLPVPQGVYNQLTISAIGASGNTLTVGSYSPATAEVLFDCERATGTSLTAQALKANHPMTLPTYVHGRFKVSDTKSVYFAKGNLRVNASVSPRTWAFEQNQWDFNASATFDPAYISHFGWGTGDVPEKTSMFNSDYSTYTDWGIHFDDLGNGSQATTNGSWRVLSKDEWTYLLEEREDYALLQGTGTIYDPVTKNFIHGLIICPDGWETPASCRFVPMLSDWSSNVYTAGDRDLRDGFWKDMEEAGAVFLPSAGARDEGSLMDISGIGNATVYWSSTPSDYNDNYSAWYRYFTFENWYPPFGISRRDRRNGASVRLVHD